MSETGVRRAKAAQAPCSRASNQKLAAYTHLVFLGSPGYPAPKVADIERKKTGQKCSGPLALGTDLMAFDVRRDHVIVIPDA